MPSAQTIVYTAKIIRAGALLTDTKSLLSHWDETLSTRENLDHFQRENIFAKSSRSRVREILVAFRQRYLTSEPVTRALVTLVKGSFPAEALDRVLYFHAARSDLLLHNAVTDLLAMRLRRGLQDIHTTDVEAWVKQQIAGGKTVGQWSDITINRCAREILSTLRDFGVLQGAVKKRIAPMYLPIEAFAFLALCLRQNQPSGERLLSDPDWGLFFLSRQSVERFFLEAHQQRLLEYHAAGSIIRVTFPTESLQECEILGVKELRDYFRRPGKGGFWMDHVRRYSKSRRKAPIYWLLQSSKKNCALWLYYHRLDKDILFKALVNYVEPKIRLEPSRLDQLRAQHVGAGTSGREAKQLEKQLDRQDALLSELNDFRDKLRRAAELHLEPDLNDGVVLNIAPLRELVSWSEARSYWEELLAGKYEWSSIGKQLRERGMVKG